MNLNEQIKNHGYIENYEIIMNLAQTFLVGCGLAAFFSERRAQERNTRHARPMIIPSILRSRLMIAQYLNCQSALLTSKVDG
jgi:hypothetical protein